MTIRVERHLDPFALYRRLKILLDGQPVAGLKPGDSVDLIGPGGEHEIRARLDWTLSPPLLVTDPGEGAVVTVIVGFRGMWEGMWRSFLTPRSALTAEISNE